MAEKANEKKEEKKGAKTAEKVEAKTVKKAEAPAKKAEKAPAKKVEKKPAEDTKVYHISKRKEDRKWQVKAEGSPKAVKTFFTQEEAVDFAKRVVGNNEGRIVIHKEDGSFRKLKY